jgi:hypothetical protein
VVAMEKEEVELTERENYPNMHFLPLHPTQKDPVLSIHNVHHIIAGRSTIITDLLSPSTSFA